MAGTGFAEGQTMEYDRVMDGQFWRAQVLDDLIPLWYEHVRDPEHGAFYLNLARDWQPLPPWDKSPAMISRQVFGFSAAFLLSGEQRYLTAARDGVDYLLSHAWDEDYGDWFDHLTPSGDPDTVTKSVDLQLYTNVGLAMYYFVTGDEVVLARIMRSLQIRQEFAHDVEYGGYYQVLNRDLSIRDDGKNKHAHYGYVGSLLLNLYLATRDPGVLRWEQRLTDLSLAHMMDAEHGWIYGFGSHFDRRWKRTPNVQGGTEVVSTGAQLTAALSFLRLYHQTGEKEYLRQGKALGNLVTAHGWDARGGAWLDYIGRTVPYAPGAMTHVSWWSQIYGAFLQLQLYNVTQDDRYLACFRKSEAFFLDKMIDRDFGGVFATVSPEGRLLGDGRKAGSWHTSYHEVEHGLLNYLYLNLYVNDKPAELHFSLRGGDLLRQHFVSLVDDPRVEISGVEINGSVWTAFDARQRSVTLPVGDQLHVKVTLRSGRRPYSPRQDR